MKLAVRIAISLGILVLLAIFLPWSQLSAAFARLPLGVWIGVLAIFLAGHGLGVLKWRMMVNAGRSALAVEDAARCYAAGLFANLCLPSIVGGDVLRGVLAARVTGRSEAALWGGLADRMIDVLALAFLLVAGALAVQGSLPAGLARGALAAVAVGLVVGLGSLALASRLPLARWPAKLRRPVARSLVALRRLRRTPGTALTALCIALSMQTAFVLLNAWIGHSIGVEISLGAWFFAWPLAKVAGLAPISLGGLGVRDATLGGLLAPFGVPVALGVVTSLIWQTVLIAGGVISGLGWWLSSRRRATWAVGPEILQSVLGGAGSSQAD
jgi:uncharacterized membrane protein YbhN (UPF0104 family)